jgi:hypothetical protein
MKVSRKILDRHTSIAKVPNRVGAKKWRLRFKNLKELGRGSRDGGFEVRYGRNRQELEEWAAEILKDAQAVGVSIDTIPPDERQRILTVAAQLRTEGLDPIKAMQVGGSQIRSILGESNRLIGEFWTQYRERKLQDKKWGAIHAQTQFRFYADLEDSFMKKSLRDFMDVHDGRQHVRKSLMEYKGKGDRGSRNTIIAARSKMKNFLLYIASQSRSLKSETVKEIFADSYLMPSGLKEEQENRAITSEQAFYLIGRLAKEKLAGWIVFKIFMGARTILLQNWCWEIVNWKDKLIQIPKAQTKLKKSAITFSYSAIPNFEEWLQWAFQIDEPQSKKDFITPCCQPAVTNLVKRAINQNRTLFGGSDDREIIPVAEMRNFMRSGFITYALHVLSPSQVMTIAEDSFNLHKYFAVNADSGSAPEAERFWKLHPNQIDLDGVAHLRKKQAPRLRHS